jgi:EmrB/QacA subfamily drug resistance transporter
MGMTLAQNLSPSASADSVWSPARQRWTLALTSCGSFMVVLDLLAVSTALTSMRRSFGASISGLEWTVNAYTLSFAVLMLTCTALGDRFGRRLVFALGLSLFAVGSAACALSTSLGLLIAARVLQGAGAAAVMPLGIALLNGAYPPRQRGRAIGLFGGITAMASVVGPIVGGVITQDLTWRWIFWVNVPLALAAAPLALTRLPESRARAAGLDPVGVVLAGLGVLGLVWGLVRDGTAGWSRAQVLGALVEGFVFLVTFVFWERRAATPMLPPRLLRSRGLSGGSFATFFVNGALTGALFFCAQFLQTAQGQGPIGAGVRLLPWGLVPAVVGMQSGRLIERFGERRLVLAGALLEAAGLGWLAAAASPTACFPALGLGFAVTGLGIALAVPASTKAATSSVAPADFGKAASTFSTLRQLGAAFGVAILAAAFATDGGYGSPHAYALGFTRAMLTGALLAGAAFFAGLVLPRG